MYCTSFNFTAMNYRGLIVLLIMYNVYEQIECGIGH